MTYSIKQVRVFIAKSNCYYYLKSILQKILSLKLIGFIESNNLNKVCTKTIKINDISDNLKN